MDNDTDNDHGYFYLSINVNLSTFYSCALIVPRWYIIWVKMFSFLFFVQMCLFFCLFPIVGMESWLQLFLKHSSQIMNEYLANVSLYYGFIEP